MDIGQAVEVLRGGGKVCREGWNEKGTEPYVYMGQAMEVMRSSGGKECREGWSGKGVWIALQVPNRVSKMTEPYVYMRTAQDGLIPWQCSQADLLATDWVVYLED